MPFSLRGVLARLGRRITFAPPRVERASATSGRFREVTEQGYRIRLDLDRQILVLSCLEAPLGPELDEEPPRPTPGRLEGFVSAALLVHKAKRFDDGLYAAVERAAQEGAGAFRGKASLLLGLSQALEGQEDAGEARALLLAAGRLGGLELAAPPPLEERVEGLTREFLADASRAKPLGFYTWSEELGRIFRQDRMLQGEMPATAIRPVVEALQRETSLRETYAGYLELVGRLTNPLPHQDLRSVRVAGAARKTPRFFPPSVSHEGELTKMLFGDGRPVPEGFSLMEELIRRIRADTLPLTPRDASGWYDYQTWAQEPFVIPERMPEAAKLRFEEHYRALLLELFRGAQALTRETHVKQLDREDMASSPHWDREAPPIRLTVHPDLAVEPLCTHYLRRASGYRFVRKALEAAFGTDGLVATFRLGPEGPSSLSLARELDEMEGLFRGAYFTSCREIGLAPAAAFAAEAPADPDVERLARWAEGLGRDPDLGRDARMMVPIFHDLGRRLTKVWVFLGWVARDLSVHFQKAPAATILDGAGRKVRLGRALDLTFAAELHCVAQPVTAEVYVSRLLDRDEFRRHCDRHRTRAAILANLT